MLLLLLSNNLFWQIEEEIEEITEYDQESENNPPPDASRSVTKSGPWLSSRPSLHSVDCILAELNSEDISAIASDKNSQVPFPEFGVDIVLHHKTGTTTMT